MSLVLVRFGRAARALRRRLGLRYGVSVLLLGAVLLSSFLALASAEAQLREGGHRVDVAGRQRMLTQQIALQSLLAVRPGPPVDREEARGALRAALGRMRAEHDLLRTGSARLGLSAASAHARRRYAGPDGLDAQLASFWSQAAVVAEDGPAASDGGSTVPRLVLAAAERVQRAATPRGSLTTALERMVAFYDADVTERLATLHALIVAAGGALLLLGGAVLVPLGRALRHERSRLLAAHDELIRLKAFDEAVLESVTTGVLAVDADGRLLLCNGAQRRLTGIGGGEQVTAEQFATRVQVLDLDGVQVAPVDAPVLRALRGRPVPDQVLQIAPAGEPLREVLVTARQITAADGRVLGAVSAFTDLTDERAVQAELREQVSFHDAVLAASPDLIYVMDLASSSNIWSSRTLADLLGYRSEQLRDMGADVYASLVHADDLPGVVAINAAVADLADGEVLALRLRVMHADGEYRTLARRVTPFRRHADGTVEQLLGVARDISEAVRMEERLREAALHDALTGLPNRRLLSDRIATALRRNLRSGEPVPVLFCDLDGFKHVNDTGGHAAGDAVLIATAARLTSTLRPQDTVARVGGDEFVVLLDDLAAHHPGSTAADSRGRALAVAARMSAALAEPVLVDGVEHQVTVSIGLTFASPGSDPEEALRDADSAMYQAKRRGKNRQELFDGSMRADATARGQVEQALRAALGPSQAPTLNGGNTGPVVAAAADRQGPLPRWEAGLSVHYQPIVDLADMRTVGVEALARLHDHRGMPIGPQAFIAVAEETGMIAELGRLVLGTACADLAAWHALHPGSRHVGVSVNLSARQAGLADLSGQVRDCLSRHALTPSLLTLELTESVLLEAGRSTMTALRELRRDGVLIAIDDFGTGYASLRYLAELPVTSVKIDRSFTAGLPDDPTSVTIVRAVAGLARDLGIGCVVEGIETDAQLLALPAGVLGQGFLLGRPGPAQVIVEGLGQVPPTPVNGGRAGLA